MVCWKWWHKAFWGLLDAVYTNAYIIFKHWHKDITHHEFLVQLQTMMVDNVYGQEHVIRAVQAVGNAGSTMLGNYVLVQRAGPSTHHCVVCLKKWHDEKKNMANGEKPSWHSKRTKFKCDACNKHLCPQGCFAEFHQLLFLTSR